MTAGLRHAGEHAHRFWPQQPEPDQAVGVGGGGRLFQPRHLAAAVPQTGRPARARKGASMDYIAALLESNKIAMTSSDQSCITWPLLSLKLDDERARRCGDVQDVSSCDHIQTAQSKPTRLAYLMQSKGSQSNFCISLAAALQGGCSAGACEGVPDVKYILPDRSH